MRITNGRKITHLKIAVFIISLPLLFGFSNLSHLDAEFNTRGLEAGKAGLYDQALDWFNKAIEKNPNESYYFMNRAISYQALKQSQKALDDYGSAIKLNPANEKAYANRGNLYDELGELDRALDDYSEAIRINPRFSFGFLEN